MIICSTAESDFSAVLFLFAAYRKINIKQPGCDMCSPAQFVYEFMKLYVFPSEWTPVFFGHLVPKSLIRIDIALISVKINCSRNYCEGGGYPDKGLFNCYDP